MKFGLQIPTSIAGVTRERLLAWARLIDQGPFASLGSPDRYVYANWEPMVALAAAAAVTERVRIATTGIIPTLRNRATFAKQVATLAALAPGRLTLGVVVGARPDDFELVDTPWEERGQILDDHLAFLETITRAEREDELGPRLHDIEILIGGASPPALRRLARFGHGYLSGGIRPEFFGYDAAACRGAWEDAGRAGSPRLVAGTWYASSTDPDDAAARNHASYFAVGGPPPPVDIGIVRGREDVRRTVEAFAAHGADEVVFWPLVDDLAEAEWLAEVVEDLR